METIQRRRPKNSKNKVQNARAKYFISNNQRRMIPVCLNTFLKALGNISRFRVNNIGKRFYNRGELPKERRGGDTTGQRFIAKKENVMKFINRLKCSETHYCTYKTGRKYLPSELNIKKLWRMYNSDTAQEDLKVKEPYFRYIFNRFYNLRFGSPRVDVCSVCLQLAEQLKSCRDEELKATLITEKRVHKLKSEAFYNHIKDDRQDLLILSFDCQKNQPLPKLPDQSTYYSRQLYLNNFCVVQGHSKSPLTKENVTCYVWTENEFSKGSNEISSCLFDCLNSCDLQPYNTVRLVSDGCGGQNKNSILTTMVGYWFYHCAPPNIVEVQLVFPMTGHSFLPPDRVFGNIEKDIRRHEVIASPEEYVKMIENFSTVKRLGEGVVNKNWKEAAEQNIKKPGSWHFGIQLCKRMYFTKKGTDQRGAITILVQGETPYRVKGDEEIHAKSITKRGKSWELITPEVIPKGNYIAKVQKKEDVDCLLKKHYGENWREDDGLNFFKHVLDGPQVENRENDEEQCHVAEEVPTFQI